MAKQIKRTIVGDKSRKRADWGFSRGVVYKRDRVYILSVLEELEEQEEHVTQVLKWSGKWDHWMVEWATGAIVVLPKPELQVLTMGLAGMIHIAAASGFSEEEVDASSEGPAHRGMLKDMRVIGNHVYVTGMGRQVYRRASPGRWVRADRGALAPKGKTRGLGFNSIDGVSEKEIYAVGWKGEIWQYDGALWQQLESPTNVILERVLCVGQDTVYACGQAGVLLRGRMGHWETIEQDATEDDFWGMEWFDGKLWLATLDALYTLDDAGNLSAVGMGKGDPLTCGWLSANDGVLWSIGEEDLAYFDGRVWTEVILQ